ncbi:hypothetical protein F4820DRAFT_329448 [Hypoxylon rubiginosum]|uniref:Uncharacterized protein n=1 Tax=Hypoxylon rubiginosum TaxID=110542 RepID=A0ACB9YZ02_9PEZI|nr:hypothetical protein F4820DRAFT_329448 [Hypoxylon rubiginosum]
MAVTELAWLKCASEAVTTESKEATDSALNVQDEWCARNAPNLPKARENRGVGFFQQVEDPTVTLLTAHWESTEQHKTWIESPENQTVFPGLGDHFQLEKTVFFHLDDVELFEKPDADGEISLLESPVISVGRLTIAAKNRQAVGQGWNEVKGILETFAKPNMVKSGWRIEKEDQGLEEFVFACGWPSVERHGEFATTEDFQKYASALLPFVMARDAKHYQRIL